MPRELDEEEHSVLTTDTCTDSVHEEAKPRRHVFFVIGGAVALVLACGAISLAFAAGTSRLTVRELLESPETEEIITNNIMSLGHHAPSEKEAIRKLVDQGVRTRMADLQENAPATYEKLRTLQPSEELKNGFLNRLRLRGDERLHKIRNRVMAAIKRTIDESGDHETLQRHLAEALQPHVSAIRQLNAAYFPKHAHIPEDMVLNAGHFAGLRFVKTFDDKRAQLKTAAARNLFSIGPYGQTSPTPAPGMFSELKQQIQDSIDSMQADIENTFGIPKSYNPDTEDDPGQCLLFVATCGESCGTVTDQTCMNEAIQGADLDPDMLSFFGITTTTPGAIQQVQNYLR